MKQFMKTIYYIDSKYLYFVILIGGTDQLDNQVDDRP